jgi:hypothetical protein
MKRVENKQPIINLNYLLKVSKRKINYFYKRSLKSQINFPLYLTKRLTLNVIHHERLTLEEQNKLEKFGDGSNGEKKIGREEMDVGR